MEPIQFCYWLQGFAEINGKPPTDEQWMSIREHLQTVFVKVTPKTVYRDATTSSTRYTANTQTISIC